MSRPSVTGVVVWAMLATVAGCQPEGQPTAAPGADVAAAAPEQPAGMTVDSAAVRLLKGAMDHLSSLQRFSLKTHVVSEDLLDTGHRIDLEFTGGATVERPNKLRGERFGLQDRQTIYYDGTTLTLYDHEKQAYASRPAPGTIPEMFEMAYDSLGLSVPISDILWPDVFPLMIHGVTFATVVDKEVIGGVTCEHLLFSRPGVDFQIWIPESGPPLPRKYIVTDTSTPALLSMVVWLSDWKVDQPVPASTFTFVPPDGAKAVIFLPPAAGS